MAYDKKLTFEEHLEMAESYAVADPGCDSPNITGVIFVER